jgi:hypothetical protein
MEDIITPLSSNRYHQTTAATSGAKIKLESVDTDLLYNLLIQHNIPSLVAQCFKSK